MTYLTIAQTLIQNAPHMRTLRGEHNNQIFWVKRATPNKQNIWHKLQPIISFAMRSPIFNPTASTGGSAALHAEAKRLISFKQHGILTPKILDISNDMLILSDIGTSIPALLSPNPTCPNNLSLLRCAARALAQLHNQQLIHARPFLRDMTWNGEEIGFLDLEEDTLSVMPFPHAQARDIWLFLCSVARHARLNNNPTQYDPHLTAYIYATYKNALYAPAPAPLSLIKKRLSPLANIIERHLWHKNFIGKDVRHAVIATHSIALN